MQRDWFMYHLRSNYKNRLEFPFKFRLHHPKFSSVQPHPSAAPKDSHLYSHDTTNDSVLGKIQSNVEHNIFIKVW